MAAFANDDDADLRGVAYQNAGQVRQALAQLKVARIQGNDELVMDAHKRLAAVGYVLPAEPDKPENKDDKPESKDPESARVDTRRQPPEGRSASPPSVLRTDVPAKPAGPSKPSSA